MNAARKKYAHHATTVHNGKVFTYTHSAAEYDAAANKGDYSFIHVPSEKEVRSYHRAQEQAEDARQARCNPFNA